MAPEYPVVSSSNETSSSFAGIIEAFNELRNRNGTTSRSYPASYQGIIAAIIDLNRWSNTEGGPVPPGWEVESDQDGNIIGGGWNTVPADGTLWFDTRQGRLFIWVGDDFYQTNGGDGLTLVQEDSPGEAALGQLWWVPSTGNLYIYDGSNWVVAGAGGAGSFSTASLPLSSPTINALQSRSLLPDTAGVLTQSDLNKWIGESLDALELAIENSESEVQIQVVATAPTGEEGDLWYDTTQQELKVFVNNSWVPAEAPSALGTQITNLQATVASNYASTDSRINTAEQSIQALQSQPLRNLQFTVDLNEKAYSFSDSEGQTKTLKLQGSSGIAITADSGGLTADGSELQNAILDLQQHCADQSDVNAIETRTTALETDVLNVQQEPKVDVNAFTALETTVNGLPTQGDIAGLLSANNAVFTNHVDAGSYRVINMAEPSISTDGATRNYVDALRSYVEANFANRIDSNFRNLIINRSDITKPGIDFSMYSLASKDALKFKTNSPGTDNYVTFGTSTGPWEYSWRFDSDEAFNWIHDNERVFAIQGKNAYAKDLVLCSLNVNSDGPVYSNPISVRTKLADLETSTTTLAAQVNQLNLDADTKIYYSDSAPTTNLEDGDLWFDSQNLRLNVRHSGVWVFPDRVEDVALKTALLAAVNTSTDYASLKANLISALS